MNPLIVIVGAVLIVSIAAYIIFNLLRKVETLEELTEAQKKYIDKFSETVAYSSIRLDQIDAKGSFRSDDEIGWFFDEIKELQDIMNQYNVDKTVN